MLDFVENGDNDIVELVVHQSEPLSSSALKTLKKKFACISSIAFIKDETAEEVLSNGRSRKFLSDEELFKNFYKSVRGYEASEELIEMFNLCKGEEDEAD